MGAWFYTLGQKTQLFLPYRAYICAIDVTTNTLTVSADKETHQLYTSQITFTQRQRSGTYTNHIYTSPIPCQVKCRYRQDPIPAQIVYTDGIYMCITHDPQRAVTPGQIVVAYDDHECVI
jgi:tRNA-specific 2-thiouridylase